MLKRDATAVPDEGSRFYAIRNANLDATIADDTEQEVLTV